MAKLATKLLLEAELLPSGQYFAVQYETRFSLRERLRDLDLTLRGLCGEDATELKNTPRLAHPQYSPNTENELETIQDLNSAMATLTGKGAQNRLSPKEVAEKVAHNLMVSPVPPSLSTMSALIGGFSQMRQYGMAEAAVEAIFQSHMRLDEIAIHAMLVHFVRKNDYAGFHYIFKKMEGFHGGLMLARPEINADQSGGRVRRWNDKNIQSVEYDAAIYRALISGYLRFGHIDRAQHLHERMCLAGFQPDIPLLSEYLAYYTRKEEWSQGLRLWNKLETEIYPRDTRVRIIRGTQEHMAIRRALRHCKACQRGYGGEYTRIYRRALEHGLPMDALLPSRIPLRHATINPFITSLQRHVRVLMQKAEQHATDLQVWALQALAARMILAGRSVAQVREMFYQYDSHEAYVEWYTTEALGKERAKQAERARLAQPLVEFQEELSQAMENVEPAAHDGERQDETHWSIEEEAPAPPSKQVSNKSSLPAARPVSLPPTHRQWDIRPSGSHGGDYFSDFPALDSALAG